MSFQINKKRVTTYKPTVKEFLMKKRDSLVAQMVESTCNARDLGSAPGSGRSPEGNVNPLQYS